MSRTFVGFGFGAIQGGLFLPEAFRSGNFSRLVVSEIDAESVAALRADGGTYFCNIAGSFSVETICVEGVEILNPLVDEDRKALVRAISEASELATARPRSSWQCTLKVMSLIPFTFFLRYSNFPQPCEIFQKVKSHVKVIYSKS